MTGILNRVLRRSVTERPATDMSEGVLLAIVGLLSSPDGETETDGHQRKDHDEA
jgi:hypothetical protein